MYWLVQTFVKNEQKQFGPVILILWVKLNWKLSLLLRSEISGPFVNTLTADDTYSYYQRENFPQAIQMQLSKQTKIFYEFSIAILKSLLNFQHFEQKAEPQSSNNSEIIDSEKRGYLIVSRTAFHDSLSSRRVNASQTLMKSIGITLDRLLHQSGRYWIRKHLSWLDLKS